MDDLDVIEPAPTTATFNGQPVYITPLKVGQLPAFARAIKPISADIEAIATGAKTPDMATIMGMIADHGDALVDAVAIASGVPPDKLRDATPDQFVELAAAVIRVNADFFVGRLTPALLAVVRSLQAPGAGPTA